MRYIEIKDFLSEDIDIREIRVLPIRERINTKKTIKKKDFSVMFMYISGRRRYMPNEGSPFFLNPNDIMYVPEGAAYKFSISEGNPLDYAIAVNFSLKDENGESVCIGKSPTIITTDRSKYYESLFLRLLNMDSGVKANTLMLKSSIYRLFHEIFTEKMHQNYDKLPWREIFPAIDKIESFPAQDISIPEFAKLCGVCETKFRKLFNQYTGGLSPVQYRNKLRMEQAVRSLKTREITAEQAAYEAGFKDMAYFYRCYKKYKEK